MKTILLFIAILTLGCSPEYYVPNSQNIPIMKAKGQTNLGFGYNKSEYTGGLEIQTAHAISNHIALQFNGDWVKKLYNDYFSDGSKEIKAKGNMFEFGAGYFKNVAPHFVFETYGLFCFGNFELSNFTDQNGSDNFSAKFNRIGIQPSLSYSRKNYSFSFSSRLAHLKYKNIHGGENTPDFDPNYLRTNNTHWLLEPALTIQAGTENLKFQLQYVYSENLTNSKFPQEKEIFSIGLKINLNPTKLNTLTKGSQAKTSFKTSSDFGFLNPSKWHK